MSHHLARTNHSRLPLPSKGDQKEQFEALKLPLDGLTKAIEVELPSFISDIQAIVNEDCGEEKEKTRAEKNNAYSRA